MNSIVVHTCQTQYVLIATTNRLEALVEIYRMMRPGEPPTKDAAEGII